MQKLLLSAILLAAVPIAQAQSFLAPTAAPGPAAQTAAPPQGWSRVQALAPNTALHIAARTHNLHCALKSVDADSLTCAAGAKSETFARADIKSIKTPHRLRSTVVGFAAGAGLGAAIGAGLGQNGQIVGRGGLAAIFAVPLALIGALVGAATDFTSSTVYRA